MKHSVKAIFILVLFCGSNVFGQISKNTDSLFMVKNYLLDIQNTVNSKENPKQKTEKLTAFIRSAAKQKAVFGRNIHSVAPNNQEAEEMKTSLNFVLQSMVLYKSDLKEKPAKPCGTNEAAYLNKNITILVNKINHYSESVKRKQKENTY